MTEPEKKISMTIRLTIPVHEAMEKYKRMTGLSISSQIYSAIASHLFQKRLMSFEDLNGWGDEKKVVKTEPMPEGVKFCDGDSCEIDYIKKTIQPITRLIKEPTIAN